MLKISNLTATLDDKPIISDLSLEMPSGAIHALMGPNGSGKSTLAASIMGFEAYEIIAGTISFNGEDLLVLPIEKRARAGIFLASQQPPAVPGVQVFTFLKEAHRMLVGEDLSVGDFKENVYKAFDAVGLDHSFVYRNVHDGFSGGEKKRFEIAQLLLFKPKLAILDEIDSGLDVDALNTIAHVLRREQEERDLTLLVITHYNRLLDYLIPDVVHIISKGKIWATGDYGLAKEIEKAGYGLYC